MESVTKLRPCAHKDTAWTAQSNNLKMQSHCPAKSPCLYLHRDLLTQTSLNYQSLWFYCGSSLSFLQSISIRVVNYLNNSRQLICFVHPRPTLPPAISNYLFSRRRILILSLFLPNGLINCTVQVERAVFFLFVCILLIFL